MDITLTLIQSKIYEVRGQKVMLDFDLAEMYQVETRILNQSVKRNQSRFPEDFMFQLTNEESALPLAFTEHGVVMLSSILRSDIAIQTSVLIVRAFVAIRQLIAKFPVDRVGQLENQMEELKNYIEEAFTDYNDINEDTRTQLELINQTLAELQAQKAIADKPRNPIGFRK